MRSDARLVGDAKVPGLFGNLPKLRVRLPHDAQYGLRTIGKRYVSRLAVEYEGTAWEHRGWVAISDILFAACSGERKRR
jgi:hypothetical protein